MSYMKTIATAVDEECGICKSMNCEICRIRVDLGDKIALVSGKTKQIVGVDIKSQLAKTGAFILSCMKVCVVVLLLCGSASAEVIDVNRLADAIGKAENSKKYPYGIKSIDTGGDEVKARKICINTIRNHIKRHNLHKCGKDFITCLGDRYCPPSIHSLNKNWVKNVNYYYRKAS